MNKSAVFKSIIYELKKEFLNSVQSAMDAKDAATNEESSSENKYDTRGLEASYLAGAQANRAQDVRKLITQFEQIQLKEFGRNSPVESTALVKVEVDGEEIKWLFLLAQKGGIQVEVGEDLVLTISMDSPLGMNLNGKKVGDSFEFQSKDKLREYQVLEVI